MTDRDNAQRPHLRLTLGQHLREIARASDIALEMGRFKDNTSWIIDQEVAVEYLEGPFELKPPATRFVWLAQLAGHVWSIRTTPQLAPLPLDPIYALYRQLAEQIDSGAWVSVPTHRSTQAELSEAYAEPGSSPTMARLLRQWRGATDDHVLSLTLKRHKRAAGHRQKVLNIEQDLFLLDLSLSNYLLKQRLQEQVIAARLAAAQPRRPLPLSAYRSSPT